MYVNNENRQLNYVVLILFLIIIIFFTLMIKGNNCSNINNNFTNTVGVLTDKKIEENNDKTSKITATITYKDINNKEYKQTGIIIKNNITKIEATEYIKENNSINIYILKSSPDIISLKYPYIDNINGYIFLLILLLLPAGVLIYKNNYIPTLYSLLLLIFSFIILVIILLGYSCSMPEYIVTKARLSNYKLMLLKNKLYNIISTITYKDVSGNVYKYDNVVIKRNLKKSVALEIIKKRYIDVYYLNVSSNIYKLEPNDTDNTNIFALLFSVFLIVFVIYNQYYNVKK